MTTPYTAEAPLTGSFTASGQSAAFQQTAGRSFNITLSGTFVASVALERQFNDDATWYPVTYPDGTAVAWTGAVSTQWQEDEPGVQYRLNATWTSGTVNYRVSQ